jgi:hypothetical protein
MACCCSFVIFLLSIFCFSLLNPKTINAKTGFYLIYDSLASLASELNKFPLQFRDIRPNGNSLALTHPMSLKIIPFVSLKAVNPRFRIHFVSPENPPEGGGWLVRKKSGLADYS